MKAVQIVSPNNLQVIDVEKPSIDERNNVRKKCVEFALEKLYELIG